MSYWTYSKIDEPEGQAARVAARAGQDAAVRRRGSSASWLPASATPKGQALSLPHSRALPTLGARCHELRISDQQVTWRIIYRADTDAVVLAGVFLKKTQQTPKGVLEACRKRLREYDDA